MEGKYLPGDVLMIILAYLPVKSLVQFKSVCKSWKTIIEDHGFIETHRLNRAATSNGNCLLVSEYQRFSLLHRSETGVVKWAPLDLPVFKDKDVNRMRLSPPCNGILCLSDGEQDMVLWNPAIQEFKLLPRSSSTPTLALPSNESVNLQTLCTGFGFNPHTDDYKVVRILTYDNGYESVPGTINAAEVYSLNADSWTTSIVSVPTISIKTIFHADEGVFMDGKCYWCFTLDLDVCKILCFDMVEEVCEVIDLPDSNSDKSWDKLVVMKNFRTDDEFEVIDLPGGNRRSHWDRPILMKDSLAMVSYIFSEDHRVFYHIWAMKEEGSLRSWHKVLTIGPFYEFDTVVGFWNDELIFQLEEHGLVSYDYITGQVTETEIFEKVDVFQMLLLGIYNESLVSIRARGISV